MSYRRNSGTNWLKEAVLLLVCLTLALVGMKSAGTIGWSWWIVTAPLTVPFALFCLLVVVCICIDLFCAKDDEEDLFR